MTQLFGTDGIRGRALEPPLDRDTVTRLGHSLATDLGGHEAAPRLLMAGDTRASTEILARWLATGFCQAGGDVTWAGVLPTPAVSRLLRDGQWSAGVVISASHNPAHDNGIKVLGPAGEKLADGAERRLERRLSKTSPITDEILELPAADGAYAKRYLELLRATHEVERPLEGMSLVIDAAHGAASGLAEDLFRSLGADVTAIASKPNGENINAGCGATAPEALQRAVLTHGADAGVGLDGDADRALIVDEAGRVLDGDDILLAWARHLAHQGRLPGRRVVATVMSNFGLERALAKEGVELIRCSVGDRSVWLAMGEHGAALGGEQSGHVICAHHAVSGDGLLTSSHVLAIAAARSLPVSSLSDLERLPQVLLNIPVTRKPPFELVPTVMHLLAGTEAQLSGRGRVLLRYSGTEPLARVMIEGDDAVEIQVLAQGLADAILTELR